MWLTQIRRDCMPVNDVQTRDNAVEYSHVGSAKMRDGAK